MKKEDLLHFVDLALTTERYYQKFLVLNFLKKFIDADSPLSIDLDTMRKIQLRDQMIANEGFSYLIKDGKTENIYFPKYDEVLESELLKIDTELVQVCKDFVLENLDKEIIFGGG